MFDQPAAKMLKARFSSSPNLFMPRGVLCPLNLVMGNTLSMKSNLEFSLISEPLVRAN